MVPFLSVVIVVRNKAGRGLRPMLMFAVEVAQRFGTMCEVIVVDNASTDSTAAELLELTHELPDLQVFVLSQRVNTRTAERAGLEAALGDQVMVFDPGRGRGRSMTREHLNLLLQFPPRPLLVRIAEWLAALLGHGIPRYHIAREFGSPTKTRRQQLNIEHAT